MELGGKWPVSIVATPDVAAGARLWRTAGSHRLTIVVKATFTPAHQQPMQLAAPEPIVVDDTHVEGDAARSVLAPSDLAPYLPRGEVLFVGRARSEQGAVPALSVRLGVYGPKPLVEKTLHVVGPRTLGDHGANAPEPFVDLPITYERALRGAMDENPAGLVPAPGGAMPTVLDPDDASGPAGYGPISSRWPGRRRLLRQLDPALLEVAVPELPDAFAWSYFHAAPPDQRCTFFTGDEWVVLDHLWRGLARLESRLPGARAGARVYDGGAHVEVPLIADTLFIDGHREVVSLVWRGNVAVDPARLGAMEVLAGLELPGRPIPWPGEPASPRPEAAAGAPPAPPTAAIPEAAYTAQPHASTHASGSYGAVGPTHGSGSYAAVAPEAPAATPSLAATTMSAVDARPPSSPPTPMPRSRNPSGSHPSVGEPRASTPSYGIRYPTPTPGSHPALRHPTPPPMSPPAMSNMAMAPPPAAPPIDDDGGHTVMRQVDARLLEQLAGDGPATLGRADTAARGDGSRPHVPMAPGADEERSESTALFSLAMDTTLMKIARGDAPSPMSQEHPTADADAAIDALLGDPRAVPSRGPAPSQAHTARRPTGDHEMVDEQTFVHDDAELQRLLQDSAAASSPTGGSGFGAAIAPAAEEPVPATMAAPTTVPLPDGALRRAMRATTRGLGPVHVVEADAARGAGGDLAAGFEAAPPPSLTTTRTSAPSPLGETQPARSSLAGALRDELVRRIASGQSLEGAHLERADLSDLDLRGQSLVGAILRGARLERARLDGSDLSGAKLENAQLIGAQLTGARLIGAVLDGAVLDGASLLSAQLDDASLGGASLVGAVVVDASAVRASFRDAELRDARLDRSQLSGADFERARLANTSFLAANLTESSFFEATLTSASFVEATLTGARFDRSSCALAKFARASASDTLWNEAVLDGASFEAASLAGATFAKASCQGAVFSSAELAEARFQRARLDNAIFTGADLQGAVFDSPDGPPPSPMSGPLGGPVGGPQSGSGDR